MEAQGIAASGQQRSWVQSEVTIWTLYADCAVSSGNSGFSHHLKHGNSSIIVPLIKAPSDSWNLSQGAADGGCPLLLMLRMG